SARALFASAVDHLSPGELSRAMAAHAVAMNSPWLNRTQRGRAALVLAASASRGCSLTPPLAAQVADALLRLVMDPPSTVMRLAAVELVGRLSVVSQFTPQLLERLLRLSLQRDPPRAAQVCWAALLRVGAAHPEALVRMLNTSISTHD